MFLLVVEDKTTCEVILSKIDQIHDQASRSNN